MINFDKKDRIWFSSDLHFGHQKEFLWGPRGFKSSEEHDEEVINLWNSLVQPNDYVFLLGDLMLGDNETGLAKLNRLNGQIFVIWGNHDTDVRKNLYEQELWSYKGGAHAEEIKWGKNILYLSHYPTITANYDDDKPWAKRLINLHGHTHDKRKFYNDNNPFMYNVALDAHDNKPVLINDIINDINKKKEEINND